LKINIGTGVKQKLYILITYTLFMFFEDSINKSGAMVPANQVDIGAVLKQKFDRIFIVPLNSFLEGRSIVSATRPVHVRSTFYQELRETVLFAPYGPGKRASKPQIMFPQIF